MKRVLIAEDNDINLLLLKRFLKKWQLQCDSAGDGKEAVELVQANTYGLVLMDIQMPYLDGFEAARQIRQRGISLPIIALTADTSTDVLSRLCPPLFQGYLIKPIDHRALRRKIDELI